MENRHSILLDFQVEPAAGGAERRAAVAMAGERLPGTRWVTLVADNGYDTLDFVACCRALQDHSACEFFLGERFHARRSNFASSGLLREPANPQKDEEAFAWMKTVGAMCKSRYRGRDRVRMHAYIVAAAYKLIRSTHLAPPVLPAPPLCAIPERKWLD